MSIPCTDPDLEARYVGTAASDPTVLDRYPLPVSELSSRAAQRVLAATS